MADHRKFIKSATTSTPARNSRAELEQLLVRYGCDAFSFANDVLQDRAVLRFRVPNSNEKNAPSTEVCIPVETKRVYDAMFGRPTKWGTKPDNTHGYVFDPKGYDEAKLAKAERVAWRNVILWVDAQLSAAAIGLQTIDEAFLAHTTIGPNGARAIDIIREHLDPRRALGAG